MDYRKTAQEILGYVGGSKNIVSAAHCATRLRLVIADNSKADKEAIENVVEAEEITSPVNGNVVATTEVADETFASEMLGTTVAVEPTDGKIVAPCDGEVMNIFDTGHAVCIATEAGAELLIHIGIDTVSMDGKGFVKKVADGAKVRKGDVLIEADLDAIKAAGHPATTMMILTNADDFSKVEKTAAGTVTTADLAMKIEK